jgi:hypothetical protein
VVVRAVEAVWPPSRLLADLIGSSHTTQRHSHRPIVLFVCSRGCLFAISSSLPAWGYPKIVSLLERRPASQIYFKIEACVSIPRRDFEMRFLAATDRYCGFQCHGWAKTAATIMPTRRIMSKIANGRFGSSLLTTTRRNKPARQKVSMKFASRITTDSDLS